MTYKVYIPSPILEAGIKMLEQEFQVLKGYGDNKVSFEEGLKSSDGIFLRAAVPLTSEDIEKAPKLKVIARHGVGVENIDVDCATKLGIAVVNIPHANTESVSEHALGCMIALSRKIMQNDKLTRSGRFAQRDEKLGRDLYNKTLGIIGFGSIGQELARKCKLALNMEIIVCDPFIDDKVLENHNVDKTDCLAELLNKADVISLHVPLNEQTKNLISWKEIQSMKASAILLQLARGGVVNEKDLIRALEEGTISAAAIDVYECEPPPSDHPFFSMENVIVTPHTAGCSEEAFIKVAVGGAAALIELIKGKKVADSKSKYYNIFNKDILV